MFIGIPDVPESLRVMSSVTSVTLSWISPSDYHGPITHYQVSYHCSGNSARANVNTGTSWLLTGLKPETTCSIRVQAHTSAGAGDYSNEVLTTTEQLCEFIRPLHVSY